jgi:hypothetical protein
MSEVLKRVEAEIIEKKERTAICHKCGTGWGIVPGHFNHDKHLALIGTKHTCGETIEDYLMPEIYKTPAYTLVKCDCGRKVQCSGFTTTCDCGRDYNWNGTQLADRSQWGEDTGEHWTDCY